VHEELQMCKVELSILNNLGKGKLISKVITLKAHYVFEKGRLHNLLRINNLR